MPDTKEAEALAAALNHSAERVQTLWFSFLTFMLYLAIAAGTTTHRMLFLEEPLNLPVLNIKLPLLSFYILTPIIFVVLHFYMLLNLVLLARTAKSFEDSLARAFPEDGEPRENFRMRIENTLFVQLLVGGRLERNGINGDLLSAMALITLGLAPVALMLKFEIMFLPYHSEWITWLHRGLLALDLMLVWTLWPGYRSSWGVRLWPDRSWWLVLPGIGSTAALAYAAMVATFPDEHMYLAWLHGVTPVNTLDLHGEDLIDDLKLKQIIEKTESSADRQRWVATLSLRNRDLTGANLAGADVRHVEFSHAILNRANLNHAWAEKAHFDDNAQLQGASFGGAQLQGASLNGARLQGASLGGAQLQGASLNGARLQGASLVGAQLQGASLDFAQLQGASLYEAQLQGASLNSAQLQGVSLDNIPLQGASLNNAELQGASLSRDQLQCSSLQGSELQGARLDNAKLQGASLDYAELQGAYLFNAQLTYASFLNVFVWRAYARAADFKGARVAALIIGPKYHCNGTEPPPPGSDPIYPFCDWTTDSFEKLRNLIAELVPNGYYQEKAMDRIKGLDLNKHFEAEEEMTKIWADISPAPDAYKNFAEQIPASSSTSPAYEKGIAAQWQATGCASEGAPYVLRALLGRLDGNAWPFPKESPEKESPEKAKLAATFLDKDCAGARGLSEGEIAKLASIRDRAPPPSPKP
jgi:uncharacterized protein YjbI with pentapeptide repeats